MLVSMKRQSHLIVHKHRVILLVHGLELWLVMKNTMVRLSLLLLSVRGEQLRVLRRLETTLERVQIQFVVQIDIPIIISIRVESTVYRL